MRSANNKVQIGTQARQAPFWTIFVVAPHPSIRIAGIFLFQTRLPTLTLKKNKMEEGTTYHA